MQSIYSFEEHEQSEIFRDFFCIRSQGIFMEFYWEIWEIS